MYGRLWYTGDAKLLLCRAASAERGSGVDVEVARMTGIEQVKQVQAGCI
jgi:hypothetical protein